MIEIRDLIATARQSPTEQNIEALWRAVFMLGAWYFLPASSTPGPTSPMVIMQEDGAWLLAFTNFRKLSQFESTVGRRLPNGNINMLVLDPLKSMRLIVEHAEHIQGVLFNPDSDETFRVPTNALVEFAKYFGLPL
jgi:hypothetical protein